MNKPEFLSAAAQPPFSRRYGNFIGGHWVEPVAGRYFDNVSPINGRVICEVTRSGAADVEKALDTAHAAKEAWGAPPRPSAPASSTEWPTGSRRTSTSSRGPKAISLAVGL